jgi:hypothetical protein
MASLVGLAIVLGSRVDFGGIGYIGESSISQASVEIRGDSARLGEAVRESLATGDREEDERLSLL